MLQTTSDPDLRTRFLGGMAAAACTVNVVTTDGAAGRHGVTVSAMASVSADTERPTLLVCVHRQSRAAAAIIANGVFCVNVLRDDQSYISDCFAGRYRTPDGDKFSCASWATQVTGAPRVVDPLVAFDCRLVQQVEVGTHFVFFGVVVDLYQAEPGSPLIYANRAYGSPTRHAGRAAEAPHAPEALRIGAFHTFGPHLLPELLGQLAAAGPAVALKLLEGDQRRVVEGLKAGEVDLALVYDLDLGEGLSLDGLADLQPYVLLAEGHPLAERSAIALEDLAAEPMILLDAPPSGRYFLSLFEAAALEPEVRVRTLSFEMARGLVAHGLGYALLATRPASDLSYDGRPLVSRPLDRPVAPSRLVLARRADGQLPPSAEAFRRICAARFSGSRPSVPALATLA